MITINNLLLYFYNIDNQELIKYDEESKYFRYKDNIYYLYKLNNYNVKMYNNNKFHTIIRNKFNNIVSNYNDELYILLKINIKDPNRVFNIDDLIDNSKINIYPQFQKIDILSLWKNKIDYIEEFYNNKHYIDIYDFNYFRGLTDISLNILKKINNNSITYGVSYNRFYELKTLYDLFNPFIIHYGPIVNTFAEYIKYKFFYKDKRINYLKLLDLDLNINDYYYFVARLLFPTYYLDLLKDDNINDNYNLIINRIDNYIIYIKEIIMEIKKRHNDMSLLDLIINLL